MKVDLADKVALVTGAARGIGQAIADAFAANGARVIYSDIDFKTAVESAARSPGSQAVALDVTDEAQINAVVAEILRDFGRLDILVNNAGVNTLAHRVTIDQFPRFEWDRIINVDLTGTYLVSHAAAPLMVARKTGRIINIASIAGLVPLRLQSPFVAAKAGVVNLTRSMALELGPHGVLVNAIAPGSTLTEGTRQLFYGEDGTFRHAVQQMLAHIPLGRPGQPEEIAHAALFLAAPESSYINGHILTVDGGWTAGYAREF
jgi:NAD(P)-dependent dehydrogenase (short-subunit alcohol dehydrogenase family)